MPPPLTPQQRNDIIRDIKDGHTRNHIARTRGVSPSTVTKIANQEQLTHHFDRSHSAVATRAREADHRARKTLLLDKLYAKADHLLDRVDSNYEQVVSGPAGTELVVTALPPLREAQAGMSGAGIALDKAARIEQQLGDGRVIQAQSLLSALFDSLQKAHGDSPDGSG